MTYNAKDISKFLKDSVDWLIDQEMGCTTLKLDDRLAICVGWLPGYGAEVRDDVIQSKTEPDYAINAGIKVYTSDDMRTDYEFINMPYYKNGEVVQTDVSIEPAEDYDELAKYFLKEYEGMKTLNMTEDGEIIEEVKESKCLNEEEKALTKSPYKKLIGEYFDYTMDFDFLDIVANVLDRIDDFTSDEDIYQSVDDELIYTQDQWTILEFYCASPAEADWDSAYSDFLGDIMALASKIAEEQGEGESNEEE